MGQGRGQTGRKPLALILYLKQFFSLKNSSEYIHSTKGELREGAEGSWDQEKGSRRQWLKRCAVVQTKFLREQLEHTWAWRKRPPSATSVLPLSTNTSTPTHRFKHGSQDAQRRDSNYLFCFHLILASMENCRPRRGSRRPSGKRSGHCSWCSPAAARLSSGNELEAAAGHLQEFTSELHPKGAISAFR